MPLPKMPDITVLPGGRKVRTDLRPYADDPPKKQPRRRKPKKAAQ